MTISLDELALDAAPGAAPAAKPKGKSFTLDELSAPAGVSGQTGVGDVLMRAFERENDPALQKAQARKDSHFLVRAGQRGVQQLAGSLETTAATGQEKMSRDLAEFDRLGRVINEMPDLTPDDIAGLRQQRRDIMFQYPPTLGEVFTNPDRRAEWQKKLDTGALRNIRSAPERERTVETRYPVSERLERALQPPPGPPVTGLPARLGWKNAEPSTGDQLGRFWTEFSDAPLSVIGELGVQSLPTTGASIAIGLATRSPAMMAATMGALSGSQEYGGAIMDIMRESGVDASKPENVLAALRDPVMGTQIRERAIAKAIPIAALDTLSMRLGTVTMAPRALGPVARQAVNLPAQLATQGIAGGTGEALGQLASEGRIKSAGEIAAEVVAEMFGAPAEVVGMRSAMRSSMPADVRARAAEPGTGAASALAGFFRRQLEAMGMGRQAEAPAAEPAAPAAPVPPEVQAVLDANGIMPDDPRYVGAVDRITQRLAEQAQRPAPDAFNVPPGAAGPQGAAKALEAAVEAQRQALAQETAAREAVAAGMTTFQDPETGNEVSTARAPVIPRTAPPPVIALPQSPDFVPGRNQEETARLEDVRQRDAAAAAAQEASDIEAQLAFLRRLEAGSPAEPARGPFQYADEARRPLNAAETLSPEALRIAEASGKRPDQPVKPGAAAALERAAHGQAQSQAEADNADRSQGVFRVGDSSSTEPRPGLGTDAPSAPQDVQRILRKREELQRERDFAYSQIQNKTITDTERAKWQKVYERLGPEIDALSAKLDERARRAGQGDNRFARTKEQVLEEEGASVATGTSDRPFRGASSRPEERYTATPQDRVRFARALGISEDQIDANPMTRAIFQDWLRAEATRGQRDAGARDQAFEQDARSTFEKLRDRRLEDLEAEWERNRTKGRAERQTKEEQAKAEEAAGRDPKGLDKDGNYFVDDRGFVLSDKGGPILFDTQKDAGRWILKYGNKNSRDQVFDIANHPDVFGKFSVQERMRRKPQAKPDDGPPSPSRGALVPSGAPPKRGPSSGPARAEAPRAETLSEEETTPPAEPVGAPAKLPKEAKGFGLKVEGKPIEKMKPLRAPDSFKPTPQQMGRARTIQARIRGAGPKNKPQRLIDAIIQAGGIRPNSMGADDLRAMDMHKRPGFFSNKGRSVDDMAFAMQEEGFFGQTKGVDRDRMTIDEFLEHIRRDAGEAPVYRPDDSQTADFFAKEGEIDAWLGWLEENRIATAVDRPKDLAWLLSLEPWEARLRTLLSAEVHSGLTEKQSEEAAALLRREIDAAEEAEYRMAAEEAERPEAFDPELEADFGTEIGQGQPARDATAGTASPEGARAQGSDAQAAAAPEQRADAQSQETGAQDRGAERAGERRDDGRRAPNQGSERVDASNAVREAVASDDRAGEKPAAPARPTIDKTDQGAQPVIPGAERLTEQEMQKRELAKRAAEGKMKPKVRQERADDGLFDVAGRGQEDMFARKPEAPKAEAKKEEPHDGMTPGAAAFAKQYKNDMPGILGAIGEAHAEVKSLAAKIQNGDKSAATQKAFEDANQQLADLEDAYEWMEQTDAEREASRLAGKFFSNPMMDPAAWSSFFRMVDPRKVGRGFVKEIQSWLDGFQEIAELFSKPSRRQKGGVFDVARILAYSNDGMLLTLAHRYKVDGEANPVIQEFRRLWHAQPGRQREAGIAQTYGEAVSERMQARLNDLADVLAPIEGMDRKRAAAVLETAARKMRARNIPAKPVSQVDKIAAGLRDFFAQELKYQRDAGVDIGKAEGYLPRVVDPVLLQSDIRGFTADAVKAYRSEGLNEKDARAAAEGWVDRLLMGDMGISAANNDLVLNQTGSTKPGFEKSRVLGRAAEKIMEKWYIQDPAALAADYLVRATRRTELAKRLGPNLEKWGDFKEKLAESGAIEALPEIIEIVRSAAGLYPAIKNRTLRHTFALLRILTPLTYLERATVTSLSEPSIIGSRSAGTNFVRDLVPIDTLTAYLKVVGGLVNRLRGHKTAAAELAEDLGLVGSAVHGMLMQQRFGGQVDAQWAQKTVSQFFRRTGLHDFTDTTRGVAMGGARVFLRRLALRAKDGADHPVWGTAKSTEFLLGELGIPADKIKDFAAWVLKAPDGMPIDDAVRSVDTKDPMARLYRTAITRFVDQSSMRPKGAERPRWANHPVGGVFYGITSFISSFHKNVLMRTLSMAGQSADPRSGLSAYERLNFLVPFVKLAATSIAIQFGLTFLRDMLWDDPAKDPEKKRELDKPSGPLGMTRRMQLAISRSGMIGMWDIPYNAFFATKYAKDPATVVAGPVVGGIFELIKSMINVVSERNSPNTETFERAATRAAFEYFVSPVLNGVFSLLPGRVGPWLGAAGIQTTTHPKFQENTIQRPLWGPPRWMEQGGRGTDRGGRETRSGRSSGR